MEALALVVMVVDVTIEAANDPDGYDGMIFCRWTADAIGKAIKLDWEKFV